MTIIESHPVSQSLALSSQYNPDPIVQLLGEPRGLKPNIGAVLIQDSNDVHIGDKHIYHGPVTIQLYKCDNIGFVDDENVKEEVEQEQKHSFKENTNKETQKKKGLPCLCLQKLQQNRTVKLLLLLGIVFICTIVLTIEILVNKKGSSKDQFYIEEPELIKPIDYEPDWTDESQLKTKIRLVSRQEWVAQPPNKTLPLVTPVPYVMLYHTGTENCSSQAQCVFHVRQLQTYHIESRGMKDIPYNFLIGGDGAAYEGRGWTKECDSILENYSKSISIAFIGTFKKEAPTKTQQFTCKKLIKLGLDLKYIKKDYKLIKGSSDLVLNDTLRTIL
ncbi:peptidoglycan-recognition protein LC-like [Anthonomus grandis grandis]|uniref:peptidoglycan-recognition protein LC-like n=1 Tax=Anthonomus grandis grandis TaxID=2921223 RepID=UPI0021657700|nr:peptidoglycan-recognition protein LC-like [Anthonomus grandis grandis]